MPSRHSSTNATLLAENHDSLGSRNSSSSTASSLFPTHASPSSAEKQSLRAAAKAREVFETAELMEAILLRLNTRDTLQTMRVCRAMRDSVLGSAKIQRSVGLLPDYEAEFLGLLWTDQDGKRKDIGAAFHGTVYNDCSGRYCCSYDGRHDDVQMGLIPDPRTLTEAGFLITCEGSKTLQRLGYRCKTLSPCQSPVKKMMVYFQCESCVSISKIPDRHRNLMPLSNGEYITLGDVQRGLLECRRMHMRKCVDGPRARADITVEFRGAVRLKADDPIMGARKQRSVAGELYMFREWRVDEQGWADEVPGDEEEEGEIRE